MNWLDVVIVLVLAWFTLSSLRTGLLRELFSLLGALVGIYLAGRYYALAAGLVFPRLIRFQNLANVLAFLGMVMAGLALANLLALMAHRSLDAILLGWADHLAGMLFGFAKGAFLVGAAVIVLARFPLPELQRTLQTSLFAEHFLRLAPLVGKLLPRELIASLVF